MIYNSSTYCVVEFANDDDPLNEHSGYEIMDKNNKKGTYIDGLLADKFRRQVAVLAEDELTEEDMDDYLSGFESLMQHSVKLH
jgi:hypothetical protein